MSGDALALEKWVWQMTPLRLLQAAMLISTASTYKGKTGEDGNGITEA
jgi:hypothetical protein